MKDPFRYFSSSPEIIRLAMMMYVRYPASLRRVRDFLFERGINVCHETVRFCGTGSARCLLRRSEITELNTTTVRVDAGIWAKCSFGSEEGNSAFNIIPVAYDSAQTVAMKLDEIAERTGADCFMFSWNNFKPGIRTFGQDVLPRLSYA